MDPADGAAAASDMARAAVFRPLTVLLPAGARADAVAGVDEGTAGAVAGAEGAVAGTAAGVGVEVGVGTEVEVGVGVGVGVGVDLTVGVEVGLGMGEGAGLAADAPLGVLLPSTGIGHLLWVPERDKVGGRSPRLAASQSKGPVAVRCPRGSGLQLGVARPRASIGGSQGNKQRPTPSTREARDGTRLLGCRAAGLGLNLLCVIRGSTRLGTGSGDTHTGDGPASVGKGHRDSSGERRKAPRAWR